jgi:hypothetical protein
MNGIVSCVSLPLKMNACKPSNMKVGGGAVKSPAKIFENRTEFC